MENMWFRGCNFNYANKFELQVPDYNFGSDSDELIILWHPYPLYTKFGVSFGDLLNLHTFPLENVSKECGKIHVYKIGHFQAWLGITNRVYISKPIYQSKTKTPNYSKLLLKYM